MKIFAQYPWLQSVALSQRGLLLNGCSLADVQGTRGFVNWHREAIPAFEAAHQEVRANGLVGRQFTIWREQGRAA